MHSLMACRSVVEFRSSICPVLSFTATGSRVGKQRQGRPKGWVIIGNGSTNIQHTEGNKSMQWPLVMARLAPSASQLCAAYCSQAV